MVPDGSGNRIVRTWEVPDAPTGESTRYLTADGTIWKRRSPYRGACDPITGVEVGYREGDRIVRR